MNQEEEAYYKLRRRLISKSLKPGTRLREEAWAADINVNRGALRQALSRLMAEGLVVKGTRGGFFVRDYSPSEMRELLEVRVILETAAAGLAAERALEDDISELEKICDHMGMMADNEYVLGFNEADLKFHELLVRSAHNEFLYNLYEQANIPLTMDKEAEIPDELHKSKMSGDVAVHREIARALKSRDTKGLRALVAAHLEVDREND